MNWQISDSLEQLYLQECRNAVSDNEYFNHFRTGDAIGCIIENSNEEWMDKSIELLFREAPELIAAMSRFQSSDNIGGPPKFERMGYQLSPTTVRYVHLFHLMQKLLPVDAFDRITEIGGGYAGQCKIIYDVHQPRSYKMIDLPEVMCLQDKFLYQFNIKRTPSPYIGTVIAWCSWSELTKELRQKYMDEVIKFSSNFFICSNYNGEEDLEILKDAFPDTKVYNDDPQYKSIYYR